jgi:hypothetical protein
VAVLAFLGTSFDGSSSTDPECTSGVFGEGRRLRGLTLISLNGAASTGSTVSSTVVEGSAWAGYGAGESEGESSISQSSSSSSRWVWVLAAAVAASSTALSFWKVSTICLSSFSSWSSCNTSSDESREFSFSRKSFSISSC